MDMVTVFMEGFDKPFVLRRLTLPQIAILRDSFSAGGKKAEARLMVGALAFGLVEPAMTTAETSEFCATHFDAAAKLMAQLAEMLG